MSQKRSENFSTCVGSSRAGRQKKNEGKNVKSKEKIVKNSSKSCRKAAGVGDTKKKKVPSGKWQVIIYACMAVFLCVCV